MLARIASFIQAIEFGRGSSKSRESKGEDDGREFILAQEVRLRVEGIFRARNAYGCPPPDGRTLELRAGKVPFGGNGMPATHWPSDHHRPCRLVCLGVGFLVLAVLGCSHPQDSSNSPQVLRRGLSGEPATLDPAASGDT